MTDQDMLEAFEREFSEILEEIESIATAFYENPGSEELNESSRLMHTLKGNCYTAGFEGMGDLVHKFEDILGDLKDSNQSPNSDIGNLLLDVNDHLKKMFEQDPQADPSADLMEKIETIQEMESDPGKNDTSQNTDDDSNNSQYQSNGHSSTDVDIQQIPVSIDRLDDLFRESENLRAELLDREESKLTRQTGKISRTLLNIRLICPKKIIPKLKRLVRTTSSNLPEKSVEFSVEGQNTQASASVIEDLSKILPHLLKNAIDHGIETESEREEMDKKPVGNIDLKFEQISSSFVVTVSDDGSGMEPEKLRNQPSI